MAGFSGSAQFAQRLALHSPGRFRAVAIHIASSYDYPLPAARRILWCVTTGENESGYDRSLKFFNAAKDSGYAMIYKAYPGLGHRDSIQASVLACECFRFALGTAETIRMDYGRWPSVVDVVNQTVKKRDEESGIPAPFRCYLPNEKIVSAWTKY